MVKLILICYLAVFATPTAFAFPCVNDMQGMSADHSEAMPAMSSTQGAMDDCCETSTPGDSMLSVFACDSVCVAVNFFIEMDTLPSSKLPFQIAVPDDFDDGRLAGFARLNYRPPILTL